MKNFAKNLLKNLSDSFSLRTFNYSYMVNYKERFRTSQISLAEYLNGT